MKRPLRSFASHLRRSLSLRVSLLIALAGAIAVGIMSFYVTATIRDGLFDDRLESIIDDASARVIEAQSQLDAASVATQDQVQNAAGLVVQKLQEPSAGIVQAQLLRFGTDGGLVTINDIKSNVAFELPPSNEMWSEVQTNDGLSIQSVAIPSIDRDIPGIMVGTRAEVPLAGSFGLFIIYSLDSEQHTVDLTIRTLGIGTAALAVGLAVIVWGIMWRLLRPVREAAIAAERIAAGLLNERMDVRGEDELAVLGRSFNEMADSLESQIHQLEELSRFQQRFVSDVSHELRTPLTTIQMAADMLNSARLSFDQSTRRSVELLHNQLARFEALLSDLLEISRFDAGAADLTAEEQDLRPIVERVVDFARPIAESKGTIIRMRGFEHAATATMDARRVERIVRNLLVNAVEHSDEHPVDVTLYDGDTAVALRVFDTGVGMSLTTAEHVFDRFWRADPSRERTLGGSGLGLAISREDARLHGGTLEAWGEEGVCASFLMTMPKTVGAPFEPPTSVIPPEMTSISGVMQ